MANAKIEIEIRALDKASKVLDGMKTSLGPLNKKVGKLDKQFDKVDKSIKKTSGSFSKMKGLLAGAITVGGLGAFTKSVFDASSKAEDLKIALETVTGSATEADDAFKFIRSFTEKTPFEVEKVAETFMKLKSAGLDPSVEMMTMLGDVAAVSSDKVAALESVTNLFSRTVAGGMGVEELDQLADKGIPVYDILSEKLGITRMEVSKFGQTAEGALEMQAALADGFNERFGGGMERASDSLNTKVSTLKDTFEGLLIKVGEGGLSDAIKNVAGTFTDFLAKNEDLALSLGEGLGNALTLVMDGVILLMENMDKAAPIFELIGSIWTNILSPALSVAFDIIVKVAEAMAPLVDTIGPAMSTIFETIGTTMTETVVPAIQKVIDIIAIVVDKISGMIDSISAGLTKVREFGAGVKGKVTGGISSAGEFISDKFSGFFADGGILPSGKLGIVGEEGPELITGPARITPFKSALSQVGGSGASSSMSKIGASTANANINFHISNVDVDGNGQMQGKAMKQYIECISMQVATKLLRQNQGYGGLI